MSAAGDGPVPPGGAVPSADDAGWRRLHPLTPLLRGGIVAVAIVGWVFVQLRDAWLQLFIGGVAHVDAPEDPALAWLAGHGLLAVGLLLVVLLLVVGGGWLAWRMHEYRITDELVEEREGVFVRRHRRARLDRVQGVQVERPLLPRLLGLARIDVSVAGGESGIRLAYLRSAAADELRGTILRAAVGARSDAVDAVDAVDAAGATAQHAATRPAADVGGPGAGDVPDAVRGADAASAGEVAATASVLERRLQELAGPELDVAPATPSSLVRLDTGRLVGSTALRVAPWALVVAALAVAAAVRGEPFWLLGILPLAVAVAGWALRTVTGSMRYSIVRTPHGIRVGHGLLSTANETIPTGRIHALEVRQPLVWRWFGWWEVRANVAASGGEGAHRIRASLLPVGTRDEVARVVALVDPDAPAMLDAPIAATPRRARVLRPWSWRRNGVGLAAAGVVVRRGPLTRRAILVPYARVQSTAISDGPVARVARLASLDVHTVAGVVSARVGAIDRVEAEAAWRGIEAATLAAMEAA